MPLLHQAFLWLWGASRCGASLLMLGPACPPDLPASKAGDVLLCLGRIGPFMEGLLNQAVLLAVNATTLSLHDLDKGG